MNDTLVKQISLAGQRSPRMPKAPGSILFTVPLFFFIPFAWIDASSPTTATQISPRSGQHDNSFTTGR